MNTDKSTALITGASRGIGKAAAEAFAKHGYDLVLTCRDSMPDLEALAKTLHTAYGISCRAVQADMGSEADVTDLFSSLETLDVLINNAGISFFGLLSQMTAAQWHRIMAVNLDSCFYTCRGAIPLMLRAHRGRILNISSVWGSQGASMEVAYSASKGGVNTFTKALAKEEGPSGITVNCVAPGVVETDMMAVFSPEDKAALAEETPLCRLGAPEDVAAAGAFLASDAGAFFTGQVLAPNGGFVV